jgi:REP element-mobilizing transposase RayT
MARPLRIEFPGAIYHVMARGNARQALFHGDDDYQRMLSGLEKTVQRTGWEVHAYVWMPNHIHLLFRTPMPNLSKGMQYLLSGYANWYAKRHHRTGHLFQGRFRGELIEDETYFWNVSRYLHLNPVRGKRPLVDHPRKWLWSSYQGYCRKTNRRDWLDYDGLFRAWQGEMGGSNPEHAYRRFVEAGMKKPPPNPLLAAWEGWLLGSEAFVKRIKHLVSVPNQPDQVPRSRRFVNLNAEEVIETVANYFGVESTAYAARRSTAAGRDLAAYLAHRRTTSTLRELATFFGLTHPDSMSNLTRRAGKSIAESATARKNIKQILAVLDKTENKV